MSVKEYYKKHRAKVNKYKEKVSEFQDKMRLKEEERLRKQGEMAEKELKRQKSLDTHRNKIKALDKYKEKSRAKTNTSNRDGFGFNTGTFGGDVFDGFDLGEKKKKGKKKDNMFGDLFGGL